MAYERYFTRKTYPTTCRFCGKRVFYHTNEHGSRVFFDELGGRWPIHTCNGYLLVKSQKESYYCGYFTKPKKQLVPLTEQITVFKPNTILIKKNVS